MMVLYQPTSEDRAHPSMVTNREKCDALAAILEFPFQNSMSGVCLSLKQQQAVDSLWQSLVTAKPLNNSFL